MCIVSIVSFTGTFISVCVKVATSITVPFAGIFPFPNERLVPLTVYELFC